MLIYFIFHSHASSREFCGGFIYKKTEVRRTYTTLRTKLYEHLSGGSRSGSAHIEALGIEEMKEKEGQKTLQTIKNQVSSGLHVIKTHSAGLNYEDCIALLSSAGADVGTLGHSK